MTQETERDLKSELDAFDAYEPVPETAWGETVKGLGLEDTIAGAVQDHANEAKGVQEQALFNNAREAIRIDAGGHVEPAPKGVFGDSWGILAPEERQKAAEDEFATAKDWAGKTEENKAFFDRPSETIIDSVLKYNPIGILQGATARGLDASAQKRLGAANAVMEGRAPLPEKTPSRAFVENTIRGAADAFVVDTIQAFGIARGYATKSVGGTYFDQADKLKVDPSDDPLYKIGLNLEAFVEKQFPGDAARQQQFTQQIAQGVGSTIGFAGAGWLGSLAKLGQRGTLALIGLTGAASQSSQTFKEVTAALKKGDATETDRTLNMLAAIALGATEAAPFAPTIGSALRGVGPRIASGIEQTIEETLQEGLQQTGTNLTKQQTYQPDQTLMEGVPEGMAIGGITGGAFGLGLGGRANVAAQGAPPPVQEARVRTPGTMTDVPADTRPVAPMMDGEAQRGSGTGTRTEPAVFTEPELEAARKAIFEAAQGLPIESTPEGAPPEEPAPEAQASQETPSSDIQGQENANVPEQTVAPDDDALNLKAINTDIEQYLAENQIDADVADAKVRDVAKAVYDGEDIGTAIDKALGLASEPDAVTAQSPALTADTRQKFSEVLASKTPRSQWAEAAGVSPESLQTLINEAVGDGRMEIRFGKPVRKAAARVAPAKPVRAAASEHAPAMLRTEEKRLEGVKSDKAYTAAADLFNARGTPQSFQAALDALSSNKTIKNADLAQVLKAFTGRRTKPKNRADAIKSLDQAYKAWAAKGAKNAKRTDMGQGPGLVPEGRLPGEVRQDESGGNAASAPDLSGAGSGRDVAGREGNDGEQPGSPDRVRGPGAETGNDTGDRPGTGEPRPDPRAPVEAKKPEPRQPSEEDKALLAADLAAEQEELEAQRRDRMARNYRITDADKIGQGGPKQKVRANILAIETLKTIEDENRPATDEEKAILVKYVGWGAFSQPIFRDYNQDFAKERSQIKSLLTPEEYKSARDSTINAHYTSPDVIKGMWTALEHLGFKGGRVLEPSAGIGHFIGLQPEALAGNSAWTAVELDTLSGRITKALYGASDVRIGGFEAQVWPNDHFDLAISNVPFAADGPYDPAYKQSFTLHDYFFVKSLDKVRPGGLVAFITSSGTLDKVRDQARREMEKRGTFLGAIRLPGGNKGAFKANAGTDVTTDIIFFRKKMQGEPVDLNAEWTSLETVKTPEGDTSINGYFAANPDMMLGKMRLIGSMYGKGEPVLIGPTDAIDQRIATAAKTLPENAMTDRSTVVAPIDEVDTGTDGIKEGAFYDKGGKIYRKIVGVGVPQKLNKQDEARVKAFLPLRDTINEMLAKQASGNTTGMEDLRSALSADYDAFVKAFGPINLTNVSTQTRKNGKTITIKRKPNFSVLENDMDAYKVSAIEAYDEKTGTATKTAIFTEDLLKPYERPTITGPADALTVSLNETGRVDMKVIAEALGMSERRAAEELGDAVYLNPKGEQWQTATQYLSGDVVTKMADAKAAADLDAKYARNVAALEAVQPVPLTRNEITVPFGASYVPEDVLNAFLNETLGARNVEVSLNPATKSWSVRFPGGLSDAARAQWATPDVKVGEIVEAALNSKPITVSHKDRDGNTIRDLKAEELARAKVTMLKEAFTGQIYPGAQAAVGGWVWNDEARATRMEAIYNGAMNRLVKEQHDGSHLTFPGLARVISFPDGSTGTINLTPARVGAIWRIIQNGNTLIDHVVGAGKTWTSIMAVQEMKRLGQIRRPMFVVPNHMLMQFSSEFLQAYPGAKLLVATKDQMTKAKRAEFAAKAAAEKWDGIIITHSAFSRLKMQDAAYKDYYEEILAQMDSAKKGEDESTVKDIVKAQKRIKTKLDKLIQKEAKDEGVTFEELGVDHITVDECFPYSTPVLTDRGLLPIGEIVEKKLAVKVLSRSDRGNLEWKHVVRWLPKKLEHSFVKVTHEHGHVICTGNHKIWTEKGYERADALVRGQVLRAMRDGVPVPQFGREEQREAALLLEPMRREMADVSARPRGEVIATNAFGYAREVGGRHRVQEHDGIGVVAAYAGAQSHALRGRGCEDEQVSFRSHVPSARRQWAVDRAAEGFGGDAGRADGVRDTNGTGHGPLSFIAQMLQGGRSLAGEDAGYRSGWPVAQLEEMEVSGREEDCGAERSRVVSVEVLERGHPDFPAECLGENPVVYDIEVADNHNYFANGTLVSNCHLFKNLWFMTRHTRVKGISNSSESQRATDLYIKIRHLEKSRPGRSALFLTGTPLSNTMAEVYTMMRYLQKPTMDEYGISEFDSWAQTFGMIDTKTELASNSKDMTDITSFSKFVNIPELSALYGRIADTQTAESLGLERPAVKGGMPQVISSEPSAQERSLLDAIIKKMEELKGAKPEKGAPNFLSMFTKGLQASTDARLVDPSAPFNPDGKIGKAVGNIFKIWEEGNKDPVAPNKAQIVFLDMGVPGSRAKAKPFALSDLGKDENTIDIDPLDAVRKGLADTGEETADTEAEDGEELQPEKNEDDSAVENMLFGKFNLYEDIKNRLIEKGVPADQIAFIHDAKNDDQKAKMFEAVREGKIRVIIGSTGKMGVGTNVQKRLVALHHIDAPWRPSDLEQRDGRILRQGNKNPEIQIYRYITTKSFEAYRWQILERKASFIAQFRAGARGLRIAEDIDSPLPDASEIKAAATGDSRIIEYADLDRTVRGLIAQASAHSGVAVRARQALAQVRGNIERIGKRLAILEQDAGRVVDLKGEAFQITVNLPGGKTEVLTERKKAGQALGRYLTALAQNAWYGREIDIEFGTISGFDVAGYVKKGPDGIEVRPKITGNETYNSRSAFFLTEDTNPVTLIQSYERLVAGVPGLLAEAKGNLAYEEGQIAGLEAKMTATAFPKQAELEEKQKRLAELGAALKPKKEAPAGSEADIASRGAVALEVMQSPEWLAAIDTAPERDTSQVQGFLSDAWKAARTYNTPDGPIVGYEAGLQYLAEEAVMKTPIKPKRERKVFIMLGMAGSGKSTIAKSIGEAHGAVHIVADDAKPMIPEYDGGKNTAGVHEESSAMAGDLTARMSRTGYNLIVEKIGSSTGSIRKIVNLFKAAGYRVNLLFVDVPKEIAMERAVKRWRETGRAVPMESYTSLDIPGVYANINSEGNVDENAVIRWEESSKSWFNEGTGQDLGQLRFGTGAQEVQSGVGGLDRNQVSRSSNGSEVGPVTPALNVSNDDMQAALGGTIPDFAEVSLPADLGAHTRILSLKGTAQREHARGLFSAALDQSAFNAALTGLQADKALSDADVAEIATAYTGAFVEPGRAGARAAITKAFAERVHDVSLAALGGFDPIVSGSNLAIDEEAVRARLEALAERLPADVGLAVKSVISIVSGRASLSGLGLEVEGGLFSPDQAVRQLGMNPKAGKKIIAVSLAYGPDVALQTFTHEEIHALRRLGLLDKEWAVLAKLAAKKPTKKEARRVIDLVEASNKISTQHAEFLRANAGNVTYREIYNIDERYARMNVSEETLVEEVVAHVAADWADGHDFGTRVERVMMKIRDFIEALGNLLRGNGFENVNAIFNSVWSGEVAKRAHAETPVAAPPPIEGFSVVRSPREPALASIAGLHASNKQFDRFDDSKVGSGVDAGRSDKTGLYGPGHYITTSPEKSDLYKQHFGADGRAYEVVIQREPQEFLNWHAPLAKQGDVGLKVAEAIAARGTVRLEEALGLRRGEEILMALGGGEKGHYKTVAAEKLKALGVAGIAYTDTIDNFKSRHWDFVVFNGDDIQITHVNGEATQGTKDALGDFLFSLAGNQGEGKPVAATGGDQGAAQLNQAITSLKGALGIQVSQNLFGVTIKAGNKSVRINPRSNIRGQTSRVTGGVGVRKSRDIQAIAHEGGHSLEMMLDDSLNTIKAQFGDELTAPFAPDAPMPKLTQQGYSGLELDAVEQKALADAVAARAELDKWSVLVGNAKSTPRLVAKPKYDEAAYRKVENDAAFARAALVRLVGVQRADGLVDEVKGKAPASAPQFIQERFSPMGAPKPRTRAVPTGEALSEGFARWFEKYVMDRPGAETMAPKFFSAFEDLLEAEAPSVLEGLHTVQEQYKAWTKRASVEELSSDVVSVQSSNDWASIAAGNRSFLDTVTGKIADAYTGVIDDLSPVQMITRKLLALADRNGMTDDQGRPISLKVSENPYKITRMFRGSYATGYSWIKDGIPNHGEETVAFPGLQRAMEMIFAGGRWEEGTYKAFGQYLISKRAIAEYDRLDAKKTRLADIDSILAHGANAWRKMTLDQSRDTETLNRRQSALDRASVLVRDRTNSLKSAKTAERKIQERMQELRDDLAEALRAIDDGSDVARTTRDRKRRSLQVAERNARDARNAVADLEADLMDRETDAALLKAEIAQMSERTANRQVQIDQLAQSVALLKRERERTQARGASRPPTLESKEWHQDFVGKVESKAQYVKFAEAAQSVYSFTQGLLTIRHQAGLISDELYQELSNRKGWYVPFMRDMSDATAESVFTGNGGGKSWSPFKKFDGSDRAIIHPMEILSQEAYAAAQHIAMNEAVGAMAALTKKAGPGSAQIAELLERDETLENTPETWERVKDIAISMGIDEADAHLIAQRMEMNFANDDLQAIWSPSSKGPIAQPALPLWEGGKRKHLILTDAEFGADALQAMMGMGKEQMTWLLELFGKPARLLQIGVTTHPTFMPRNLVRDVFDAWIKTGALPIVTQARGAKALYSKDGDFLRRYTAAGGILGGRNIAALTTKEQQADILDMDPNAFRPMSALLGGTAGFLTGTIMAGPLGGIAGATIGYAGARHGGLLKMVEAVESMTRLGVASHAYKRAFEHNPNLTEPEAMLEAAFVARDVFDWNRRGSKTLSLVRMITFLNAQIQGLDRAARAMGGAGDRGIVIAKQLQSVYRRENQVPLSADEQRDLGDAYKTWARLGLYTVFLLALYAMYRDDDRYEDIKDRTKATHSWLPGFLGVDVRLPKAFEWAMPANFIEILWDKMAGRDPKIGERMAASVQNVMVPPGVPQAANLIAGWSMNTDLQSIAPWLFGEDAAKVNRQVVPDYLKKLAPEQQFDAFTSQLSKDIALSMARSGVPENFIPSPKMIDFTLRTGGYWGQDIGKAYQAAKEGVGYPAGPAPRVPDMPVVGGFTGIAARQSKSIDELYKLMSQQGGDLVTAASTYKNMIDKAGDVAGAESFLNRLDPEARAYTILTYNFPTSDRRKHPLERLDAVAKAAGDIRKELVLDRLAPQIKDGRKTVYDWENKIDMTGKEKAVVQDIMERLTQAEAWNSFVAMDRPGWQGKSEMAVQPILDELKAANPKVLNLYNERLEKAKVEDFSEVKKDWPKMREELLRNGADANF